MGGEERWCVVTGGRGFAARHLVVMLIKYGMYSVRIADLGSTIKLEAGEENGVLGEALISGRAEYVSTDLRDKSQVLKACQGAEVVFHMAAPDSSINNYHLHHSVNVQGTQNIIDACTELKVKRLVYTSSPSVVFDGVHEILNGNESLPYPAKHNDSYSATKAKGEALVMQSNGANGLLTCCIRPSSIFGPGDKLLVPSLVDAARAGKSKFIIGKGNNMYDFTYVENVAHAHVCAERALASGGKVSEKASGQAYFITNMEPIKFWEFMSLILEGLGYERPKIKIPAIVMMPIAHIVEFIYKLLAPYGMKVPQLTPSRIRLLSRSRTFDCSKANDLIGYTPIVPLQEGLRRTIESYPHLRSDVKIKRDPSKTEILLGGGRVAETLLWRDKKHTLTVMLVLATIYFSFIATGCTIITAISKLLLASVIFLFIHGRLPQKILGFKIQKIPESKFHISEATSRQAALAVASTWNTAARNLKSICRGNDSILFLKVALSLLFLSLLGLVSLNNAFVIGVPFAFVSFVVYDKKEKEIDNLVRKVITACCKLKSDAAKKVSNSKKLQ
ncbi:3beta-hydroxysteroid-dehydrogenase/decarboxylase-like [Andrographis paniculata]|uniref:3beta-hydroxysteroid- dehydrogenase/decarboxylase-like n=1 Tax=Andrographis paniculata TaxID=175694 RepID=UPI0021E7C946|nr:3beta-hydroxysteroid-dehydrogenase/decarboxylase-like [Andrographis paniculata]XP_051137794.1 3beta-hydroxysteroid-dehydrogenase/decarboxylase-like [Andrographis paniculata]XP_051137795.1 3beta-hydroxysteroid-dehydrogenase/decarboxylase-like [Andrographis paniculata]